MTHSVQRQIGHETLTIETGKYAAQANAAVTVRYGDTVILATACSAPLTREVDFMPLTIDYEERLYAIGKIPGSFFRREGRPSQEAILTDRLVDRPIRPLFPKGMKKEVQVIITTLSVDRENLPEVLAIIGSSAALSISDIPFLGPVGATRVSHHNGQFLLNPTYAQMEESDLSVVVAGTRDGVMMVESGSDDTPEEVVLEAMRRAQETNIIVVDMIDELVAAVGKPKAPVPEAPPPDGLEERISTLLNGRLTRVLDASGSKESREAALGDLERELVESLAEEHPQERVEAGFQSILKKTVRTRILEEGRRPDGRGLADIRPISCEVGVLPRTHGSGLFNRGLTQVLSIATLASPALAQKLDTLSPDEKKRFMHHYNFPPYSTGEVRRVGSPGRREIGHGALAERAIQPVLPDPEEFPYAIRLVSEVLSSNGSTSMASVCGSTLALMDAGVPIKSPVAGVAMGLVMGDNGRFAVLTDIEGMEDNLGDMDFKVAGTTKGINALQMDIKIKGLSHEVLAQAVEQAREGRLFILDRITSAMPQSRPQVSAYAPKMVRISIPVEKIGTLIGPGGKVIRALQEETGATIDVDDKGFVTIGAVEQVKIDKARDRIQGMTRELAVGDIFTGKVVRLTSFGAFVELIPGKDGLLRSSEAGDMDGELAMGQELTVMIQEIDSLGRVNLSRRALFDGGDSSREPRTSYPGPQQRPTPARPWQGPRPGAGPRPGFGPRRSGGGRPGPGSGPGQGPRGPSRPFPQ